MTDARAICWKHMKCGAAVLVAYAVIVVLSAVAYPSYRFAKSVKIAPDIRMSDGGDIFKGQLDVFGWPLRFLSLRKEADQPIRAEGTPRMRIVAMRFGWLPLALNASAVITTYCLILVVVRVGKSRRVTTSGIAIAVICVGMLLNIVRLRDRELLAPIPIYEDE